MYLCFPTQKQNLCNKLSPVKLREGILHSASNWVVLWSPGKATSQTAKAVVALMLGSGAQMFDRLPGCSAELRLSKIRLCPYTETLLNVEEGVKIAFRGFSQIMYFKSPVYNSSRSWQILSIHLWSHFPPFFSLTMTDYNSAARLLLSMAAIPHSVAVVKHSRQS